MVTPVMSAIDAGKFRPVRRWTIRVVRWLLVLDAGLLLWAISTGGAVVDLLVAKLSVTSARGPSAVLVLGSVILLVLDGTLWSALAWALARWRAASTVRRLGMVASLVGVLLAVRPYLRVPRILSSTSLKFEGILSNQANAHVADLVYQVTSRPLGQPPVVYIEDDDPRGHFASFYCYPRPIRMEPSQRRWSLVSRVIRYWEDDFDDSGFDPEPAPPGLDSSLEYARSMQTDLLVAPGIVSGYGSAWSLAPSPVEPVAFFEADEIAGLLDAEPGRAALWSDEDLDGYPDLSLQHWSQRDWTTFRNRSGLLFDPLDPSAASQDRFRELELGATAAAAGPLGGRDDPLAFIRSRLASGRAAEIARAVPQAALGDLDGDGTLDVVLPGIASAACSLLLDRGDGILVERTPGSGLDLAGRTVDCALGDVDGDGLLDLYLCRMEGNLLLRNLGGRFVDITPESGLDMLVGETRACFADLDNDARQDLLVTCAAIAGVRARSNVLYHNEGEARFLAVPKESRAAGNPRGEFSRPAVCDYDRDGYLDIALSGGLDPLFLGGPRVLKNRGGQQSSVRVALMAGSGAPGVALSLRAVTSRRAVLVRALSEMAGRGGSEPGAHLGIGASDWLRYIAIRRLDGSLAAVQSVPADSTIALDTSGGRSSLIASHPAGLLGEVALFELDPTREKIETLWGPRPPPLPDEAEVEQRTAGLLAYLEARRIADAIEVPEHAAAALFEQGRRLSVLPPRYLVEQIAVDTTGASASASARDLSRAETLLESPPQGMGGTAAAQSPPVYVLRRWMSRGPLEALVQQPVEQAFALFDQDEAAPALLTGRYGRVAAQPAGRGSQLGFLARSTSPAGADTSASGSRSSLVLLRLVASEAGGVTLRSWFEGDLLRAAERGALRAALGGAPSAVEARALGYVGHVAFGIAELSQAARSGERAEDALTIQRALERLREEVVLDAMLRAIIDTYEPEPQALSHRAGSLQDSMRQGGTPPDPDLAGRLAREGLRREFAASLLDRMLVWKAR